MNTYPEELPDQPEVEYSNADLWFREIGFWALLLLVMMLSWTFSILLFIPMPSSG